MYKSPIQTCTVRSKDYLWFVRVWSEFTSSRVCYVWLWKVDVLAMGHMQIVKLVLHITLPRVEWAGFCGHSQTCCVHLQKYLLHGMGGNIINILVQCCWYVKMPSTTRKTCVKQQRVAARWLSDSGKRLIHTGYRLPNPSIIELFIGPISRLGWVENEYYKPRARLLIVC